MVQKNPSRQQFSKKGKNTSTHHAQFHPLPSLKDIRSSPSLLYSIHPSREAKDLRNGKKNPPMVNKIQDIATNTNSKINVKIG